MGTSVKPKITSKTNKDNLHRIVIQVIHNKKQSEYSVGHAISKQQWDLTNRKVKKHPREDKLNEDIRLEKNRIEDIIFDLKRNKEHFTLEDISRSVKIPESVQSTSEYFYDYLEDYIDKNPDQLVHSTLKYYTVVLLEWDRFTKKRTIQLTAITTDHLIAFRKYLEAQENGINTIYNKMKVVRKMLNKARREGLINSNPFENITLKQTSGTRGYLNLKQLNKLKKLKKKSASEELTCDLFLFSAYTGLRFSDLCLLKKEDVQKKGSKFRISIKSKKTKENLEYTLNDLAWKILSKYHKDAKKFIFPMMNKLVTDTEVEISTKISSANAYINKILKQLLLRAEITKKNISFHSSRHSYAVISIEKGADLYVLSKMLGHSSISTTEIYAKMVDKRKDELTELWNN